MNVTTVTTTPLRDVTDGTTYCYRVIGFQDGVPVALIQDTFTVLCESMNVSYTRAIQCFASQLSRIDKATDS